MNPIAATALGSIKERIASMRGGIGRDIECLTIGNGFLLKLDHCRHLAIIAAALTHLRAARYEKK
jgi:hypothetical protein